MFSGLKAMWRYIIWGVAAAFMFSFVVLALHIYEREETSGAFEAEIIHQEPALEGGVSIDVPRMPVHHNAFKCHPQNRLGTQGRGIAPKGPGPFVSVVVFGLGYDTKLTANMLSRLPDKMAVALPLDAFQLRALGRKFFQNGHEILIDALLDKGGDGQSVKTLSAQISSEDLKSHLTKALKDLPQAIGLTHQRGYAFVKNAQSVGGLLDFCCGHHLFFLDTGGALMSGVSRLGKERGIWMPVCDIFLTTDALSDTLLENVLRRHKFVIIGVIARRGDLQTLVDLPRRLVDLGASVVPVSAQITLANP